MARVTLILPTPHKYRVWQNCRTYPPIAGVFGSSNRGFATVILHVERQIENRTSRNQVSDIYRICGSSIKQIPNRYPVTMSDGSRGPLLIRKRRNIKRPPTPRREGRRLFGTLYLSPPPNSRKYRYTHGRRLRR